MKAQLERYPGWYVDIIDCATTVELFFAKAGIGVSLTRELARELAGLMLEVFDGAAFFRETPNFFVVRIVSVGSEDELNFYVECKRGPTGARFSLGKPALEEMCGVFIFLFPDLRSDAQHPTPDVKDSSTAAASQSAPSGSVHEKVTRLFTNK